VICDNAMLAGYAAETPIIEEEDIASAASDLRLISAPHRAYQQGRASGHASASPPSGHRRLIYGIEIACVMLAVAIAAVVFVILLNSRSSAPLTQLGSEFENIVHRWSTNADNLIYRATFSTIFRV